MEMHTYTRKSLTHRQYTRKEQGALTYKGMHSHYLTLHNSEGVEGVPTHG